MIQLKEKREGGRENYGAKSFKNDTVKGIKKKREGVLENYGAISTKNDTIKGIKIKKSRGGDGRIKVRKVF